MAKSKNRIFIKQWLAYKPYDSNAPTDIYYLKMANRVRQAIEEVMPFPIYSYLENEEIGDLCCFLTSYFEDVISGTGIWSTFTNKHQAFYDKKLPFFDTADYFEDEINVQDVRFLIWYFVNTVQQSSFLSPYNPFFEDMAEAIMAIFEEAYAYAPENNKLKTYYTLVGDGSDYYEIRRLMALMLFKTYLFMPDIGYELQYRELELLEEERKDPHFLDMMLRENHDQTLHTSYTKLLGLRGNEWLAEWFKKSKELYSPLLEMSPRVYGFFLYKGQNEEVIKLEHCATGKPFELLKKSFDYNKELKEIDTILYLGMVRWKSEWWFSGIVFQEEFDADLILEERNSIKSRKNVGFLDNDEIKKLEILDKQHKAFLDYNDGSPIAFPEPGKVEHFMNGYLKHYEESLHLSEKEKKAARQRAKNEGLLYMAPRFTMPHEDAKEEITVFFNLKSGVELAYDVTSAFPMANNPFYTIELSQRHVMNLFAYENISPELVHFCLDNCMDKIPFLTDGHGKKYLDDLDFLLRFWKGESYFSNPEATLTGKEFETK